MILLVKANVVHKNSPKCLKAKKRKEKAETELKKPKNGLLLSFLKKPKISHPSSQTPSQPSSSTTIPRPPLLPLAPSIITPNSEPGILTASPALFPTELTASACPSGDTLAINSHPHHTSNGPTDAEISTMLSRLRLLVTHLPPTVPIATEADVLAQYAEPQRIDDPSISSEDIWEDILNNTLKHGLGWGGNVDVDGVLRRGKLGVEGLLAFVEYFVKQRGVSESLFEGKLSLLMEGMLAKILIAPQYIRGAALGEETINEPECVKIEAPAARTSLSEPTVIAELEINCTPHTSYPFGLYSAQHLPWNYFVKGDRMFLIAHYCKKTFLKSDTDSACISCNSLTQNSIIRGILDHMNHGTHISMTFSYLGFDELVLALKNKTNQNQTKEEGPGNVSASDGCDCIKGHTLGHSCYTHWPPAEERDCSLAGILEKVTEAAQGVYKGKSFSENERMLGTLLWRIGGAWVGHILHRALGRPSVGSLHNVLVRIPVQPSAGKPSTAEISTNALNMLEGIIPIIKNDPNTMGDVEELFRAIDDGNAHLASEATIAGVGILSKENRLHLSRIVLISVDCKKETGPEHAKVLQTVLDGLDDITLVTANK
ncbi:hypothetical protein DFP72DRAFT_851817 [Ephemerocybe angulata]|uniref:Uncharacterized protein n=1 Tax=Ephemerocybe angulata TaxID=980116 RepID=A0A8H6M1S8_9AGAR|nr:hypothetical protein DFP72DRAFT_851817 [Tulosesus angulatus]